MQQGSQPALLPATAHYSVLPPPLPPLLQVVMAVFAYVYYNSYLAPALLSVGGVLSQVMKLEPQQQVGQG